MTSALLCAVYKIGQRIVDNIELVDFGGQLLLYGAQPAVVSKPIGSVDRVFQLLTDNFVVLLQLSIFCPYRLHSKQC